MFFPLSVLAFSYSYANFSFRSDRFNISGSVLFITSADVSRNADVSGENRFCLFEEAGRGKKRQAS